MTPRMENALALADKCWKKAAEAEPAFVEEYIRLAEDLLTKKPIVLGDEFRNHCANNKLFRPKTLHPNVWVSGVRALKTIGWIHPIGKVEPTQSHNHMPSVTQWHSMIYGTNT